MYTCKIYKDIDLFIQDTFSFALKEELENNLFIRNLLREKNGGKKNDLKLAIVNDLDQVVFAAQYVNPYNLVLVEENAHLREEILPVLACYLVEENISIPGVIAEQSLVDDFVKVYTRFKSVDVQTKLCLNLMKLTYVNKLDLSEGNLRLATQKDLHFLPYWSNAFATECGINVRSIEESYEHLKEQIKSELIYIWESDDRPVSCVSIGTTIYTGKTITFVYTPPYDRGRGYSTACVSSVSRLLLEQGVAFCGLFADCSNPISNHIYHRIGYKHQAVYKEILFV